MVRGPSGPDMTAATSLRHNDPTASLWRAAQVFRLASFVYALLASQVGSYTHYDRPGLSWLLYLVMGVWTAFASTALSRNWFSRRYMVGCDQVVVIALMLSGRFVVDIQWYSGHQTLPTTLWVANAVVSMGLLCGQLMGMTTGLVLAAVSIAARGLPASWLWSDATMPALVVVGLAVGAASTTAKRTHQELRRAERAAAAAAERERLARQVHDGVLQVLSYVKRRGTEIGGPTLELATIAGEQEVALRELISGDSDSGETADDQTVDLRPLLRTQASTAVTVSTPGTPVLLARRAAEELAAVVHSALSNVSLHAGVDAHAYVLVEDLGDTVVVTVRDNGCGIADGRLEQAEREGRMGVSRSIVGRVSELGGTVHLETAAGAGTEWEIVIPKSQKGA